MTPLRDARLAAQCRDCQATTVDLGRTPEGARRLQVDHDETCTAASWLRWSSGPGLALHIVSRPTVPTTTTRGGPSE